MGAMQTYKELMERFTGSPTWEESALHDVLNLHQPFDPDSPWPATFTHICNECRTDEMDTYGWWVPWPCDTVKLILVRFP